MPEFVSFLKDFLLWIFWTVFVFAAGIFAGFRAMEKGSASPKKVKKDATSSKDNS